MISKAELNPSTTNWQWVSPKEAPGQLYFRESNPGTPCLYEEIDRQSDTADWLALRGCQIPKVMPALGYFFFLGGTTASLNALARRNFTTVLAGILIAAPV